MFKKTEMEHKYTSTGIKFWCHMDQMNSYLKESGHSIISTHISPEGTCNLNCSYCSVKKRERQFRIELDVIKDYIIKLKSRGLKAAIITGGGEPTLYPKINELIEWLKYDQKLNIALITNGTYSKSIKPENWKTFSWVRVSINDFNDWEKRIQIPTELLAKDCVVGCSCIYLGQDVAFFRKVAKLAKKLKASYVRLLPDCLLSQKDLLKEHEKLDKLYKELDDPIFFHQHKIHGNPKCIICHQAYFRPYLSEVDNGTVYPCDSVVLNEQQECFARKYQLCKAGQVLDFLDGKIKMKFNPTEDCKGCVFTENVDMLDDWKKKGIQTFKPDKEIFHKDFV